MLTHTVTHTQSTVVLQARLRLLIRLWVESGSKTHHESAMHYQHIDRTFIIVFVHVAGMLEVGLAQLYGKVWQCKLQIHVIYLQAFYYLDDHNTPYHGLS